jgi:hypothetical protein
VVSKEGTANLGICEYIVDVVEIEVTGIAQALFVKIANQRSILQFYFDTDFLCIVFAVAKVDDVVIAVGKNIFYGFFFAAQDNRGTTCIVNQSGFG